MLLQTRSNRWAIHPELECRQVEKEMEMEVGKVMTGNLRYIDSAQDGHCMEEVVSSLA